MVRTYVFLRTYVFFAYVRAFAYERSLEYISTERVLFGQMVLYFCGESVLELLGNFF